jgi:hypothetical protein
MRDTVQKSAKWLAHVSAAFAIIFASAIAGCAANDPAGLNVPVEPTQPVELQLQPLTLKLKPAGPAATLASLPNELTQFRLLTESRCLAEAMYYEARGEGEVGQLAVAKVVLNRLAGGGHGHTICGVVYEGFDQTCQFTFVCDGSLDRPKTRGPWRVAQALTTLLLAGQIRPADNMDGVTNYHTASIRASWDAKMVRVVQIGNHIFYRQPLLGPAVVDAGVHGTVR